MSIGISDIIPFVACGVVKGDQGTCWITCNERSYDDSRDKTIKLRLGACA